MNILLDRIRENREYGEIRKALKSRGDAARRYPSLVTGLCEGALDAFLAACVCDEEKGIPALVCAPDEKSAARLFGTLSAFGLRAAVYPERDPVLYNIVSSHELEHERIAVLTDLIEERLDVVVTTPGAALSFTIPEEILRGATKTLAVGDSIGMEALAAFLAESGYVRSELVDGKGQFSVRGGIIDIFPPQLGNPVRMELFGDEIDQIGYFDVMTQRKTENLSEVMITCAREILISEEKRKGLSEKIRSAAERASSPEIRTSLMHEYEALTSGMEISFSDKYISYIYPEKITLLDYFRPNTLTFAVESPAILDRLRADEAHMLETTGELLKSGLLLPKYSEFSAENSVLLAFFESRAALLLNNFVSQYPGKLSGMYSFAVRPTPSVSGDFSLLSEDIAAYLRSKYAVLLLCENEAEASSMRNLLTENGIAALYSATPDTTAPAQTVTVTSFPLHGFEMPAEKFVCISLTAGGTKTEKALRRHAAKNAKSSSKTREKILSYADLSVGDYVVHEVHGIGIYKGLESIRSYDGVRRDHIKIQYSGTDVLYVPCEQIDSVSKYIGAAAENGGLKLSRLGGAEWTKTKARVKSEVKSMAKELIALYAERLRRPGFAFSPDDEVQREFESVFEYEETDAQLIAAADIKRDMEKPVPMDRLLCGDVGFGKTEVALRAAFKAVLSSKQVAILVPTTILAMQHYTTIAARMRGFPVKVSYVSRFKSTGEQDATLRALRRGDIDIIVGTHRLLSSDVEFHDLGLVIIDEEQRFGVAHKEKLKQISKNVDVLTLTATPIPRTLNMAMTSIRDMSVLDEAPGDRLPVQTYVLEHDDVVIFEAIRRELRRGGQVFYLYNRVETIREKTARIARQFPEASVRFAHGQMEKGELADIWQALVDGEIDILVCTTIIETGVDVPNANTLIIENADRMGLAQLHQIRGRVGRSARRAYAYFTYPQGRVLTEVSAKRLQAIRDFTEFGSGFKIALRDLEIRGAGDVLGSRQHGHMESVGYDMYLKILNDAVLEEKGIAPKEKIECVINIGRDSYIPETYIPSAAQRIDIYKKIAAIENAQDVDDIADELLDRYGDLPSSVETLLSISLVRAMACECGFIQIDQEQNGVVIYPKELDVLAWSEMGGIYPGRIIMKPTEKPHVLCKGRRGEPVFAFLDGLLKNYIQIKSKKV
ncbi:MAG: transcription-repair coupling factor [Clostridiales bacterium]|nr:transcription-repair coupling factor [Clostridiales bacterium]